MEELEATLEEDSTKVLMGARLEMQVEVEASMEEEKKGSALAAEATLEVALGAALEGATTVWAVPVSGQSVAS